MPAHPAATPKPPVAAAMPSDLLTVEQALALLGCDRRTLAELAGDGHLVVFGTRWGGLVIDARSVRLLLERLDGAEAAAELGALGPSSDLASCHASAGIPVTQQRGASEANLTPEQQLMDSSEAWFFGIRAAAQALHLGEATIRRWIAAGIIRPLVYAGGAKRPRQALSKGQLQKAIARMRPTRPPSTREVIEHLRAKQERPPHARQNPSHPRQRRKPALDGPLPH